MTTIDELIRTPSPAQRPQRKRGEPYPTPGWAMWAMIISLAIALSGALYATTRVAMLDYRDRNPNLVYSQPTDPAKPAKRQGNVKQPQPLATPDPTSRPLGEPVEPTR